MTLSGIHLVTFLPALSGLPLAACSAPSPGTSALSACLPSALLYHFRIRFRMSSSSESEGYLSDPPSYLHLPQQNLSEHKLPSYRKYYLLYMHPSPSVDRLPIRTKAIFPFLLLQSVSVLHLQYRPAGFLHLQYLMCRPARTDHNTPVQPESARSQSLPSSMMQRI